MLSEAAKHDLKKTIYYYLKSRFTFLYRKYP